jgi:hypothetical protein
VRTSGKVEPNDAFAPATDIGVGTRRQLVTAGLDPAISTEWLLTGIASFAN